MAVDLQMHVISSDQDVLDYKIVHNNTKNDKSEEARERLSQTSSVWVGALSSLPSTNDDSNPLKQISNLIGESFPLLDDVLVNKILDIWKSASNDFEGDIADISTLQGFLVENKGNHVFLMEW